MEYNRTAVNSSQIMYPRAYHSNSNRTPIFQRIVELNESLSSQVLIQVQQSLKKPASGTQRCSIFHATDMTMTNRYQSMTRSQTDFAQYLDVYTYCIVAICVLISSYHGNTSADIRNNQTQRMLLNFYSLHYGIMYVIESDYK